MLLKILLSVILGFAIGMEREKSGKSVGIRTVSLVTLGSTLFVLMSPEFGDNSRIVAQVVSGIGFLGAGIIFKNNDHVSGLTSAATIWAAAAVGCLIGMDMLPVAVVGTVVIIIINVLFKYLKHDK